MNDEKYLEWLGCLEREYARYAKGKVSLLLDYSKRAKEKAADLYGVGSEGYEIVTDRLEADKYAELMRTYVEAVSNGLEDEVLKPIFGEYYNWLIKNSPL